MSALALMHSPLFRLQFFKYIKTKNWVKKRAQDTRRSKNRHFLCSLILLRQRYPQGKDAGQICLTEFCSAAFAYCKPLPEALSQPVHFLCHG